MRNTLINTTLTALLLGLMSFNANAAQVSEVFGRAAPSVTAGANTQVAGNPVVDIQGRAAPVLARATSAQTTARALAESLVAQKYGRA